MNMYEFICNIYEFLNLVGSYDPCYDPPIHDLICPTRSCLGSRVCLPCIKGVFDVRHRHMWLLIISIFQIITSVNVLCLISVLHRFYLLCPTLTRG